ncbi:hypothetical protein AC249_AIPGENE26479 [Exaiptasia diaphana]|nr:hypothetical protein AC249_AIPGENE26479 [Exaiptasia diaphana]
MENSTNTTQRRTDDAQYSYDVIPNPLMHLRGNQIEHDSNDTTAEHEVLSPTTDNSQLFEDEETTVVLDSCEPPPYQQVISTQRSSDKSRDYQRLEPLTREKSNERKPTNYQSLSSPSFHIYEELQPRGNTNTTDDFQENEEDSARS